MTARDAAWLRLHLTRGLGRVGLLRLMQAFEDIDDVLAASPRDWQQAGIRPSVTQALPAESDPQLQRALQSLEETGARILAFSDQEAYPELLRSIPDPPALLYVRGQIPSGEALAVVGARRASPAGLRLTSELCATLAGRGIAIVSGLARGIDTAAHQGALAGEGSTLAVLGCGIDQIYPPENERLYHRIAERGALISEYPPGAPPLAAHFPGRNRIISGLCRGVLVVEAAAGSGSLITVDFALEQGREVFAVPAPVFSPTSQGVNQLLKEGARLVTEAADILEVLWPQRPQSRPPSPQTSSLELPPQLRMLHELLGAEPLHVDELVRRSGLTPREVSASLLDLELQGGVEQLPGMRFLRSG
jgi:DNA processing protein